MSKDIVNAAQRLSRSLFAIDTEKYLRNQFLNHCSKEREGLQVGHFQAHQSEDLPVIKHYSPRREQDQDSFPGSSSLLCAEQRRS